MNNLKQIPGMDLQQETLRTVSVLSPCNNPNPGLYNMEEIWKDIPGYESYYMASNLGRVKSLNRKVYSPTAINKTRIQYGRIHKLDTKDKPYAQISLYKYSHYKKFLVHRLIALTFIPNPNNLPEINHINCDKSDNKAKNLEWCNHLYNQQHAKRNGRYKNLPKGIEVHSAILDDDAVRHIRKKEMRNIEYCRLYNVKKSTISCIQNPKYRRWKHIK